MSKGTDAVRLSFNPSGDAAVNDLKQRVADLIDVCEMWKVNDVRLASLAQTAFEEGAMWAVKAITAMPKEV